MIQTPAEYRVTRQEMARFERALMEAECASPDPRRHPLLVKAEKESLSSILADLRRDVAEYEERHHGLENQRAA